MVESHLTSDSPKNFQLCVIEGDGIGHEVIPAAVEVLAAVGFHFDVVHAFAGWDTFCKLGTALPSDTLELAGSSAFWCSLFPFT